MAEIKLQLDISDGKLKKIQQRIREKGCPDISAYVIQLLDIDAAQAEVPAAPSTHSVS